MARPPKAIRPVEKTINLPSDLVAKVDLILFSELEGKVPHGAWSRFVTGLIEQALYDAAGTAAPRKDWGGNDGR